MSFFSSNLSASVPTCVVLGNKASFFFHPHVLFLRSSLLFLLVPHPAPHTYFFQTTFLTKGLAAVKLCVNKKTVSYLWYFKDTVSYTINLITYFGENSYIYTLMLYSLKKKVT